MSESLHTLVLDDATSAIDARTEESIHDALRSVLAGRTTLLITHRVSTLHLADRIVVLDAGRVVEQGTHELTSGSALYRSLLSGLDEEPIREAGRPIASRCSSAAGSAEIDTHEELLALDGSYDRMWRAFDPVGAASGY